MEDDLGLVARRQREQEVLRLGVRQDAETLDLLLGREDGPGLDELGGEHAALARLGDAGGAHDTGPPG